MSGREDIASLSEQVRKVQQGVKKLQEGNIIPDLRPVQEGIENIQAVVNNLVPAAVPGLTTSLFAFYNNRNRFNRWVTIPAAAGLLTYSIYNTGADAVEATNDFVLDTVPTKIAEKITEIKTETTSIIKDLILFTLVLGGVVYTINNNKNKGKHVVNVKY